MILLAAMGGTIASLKDANGLNAWRTGARELTQILPDEARALVRPVDVCEKSSRAIDPSDMCLLAHIIQDEAESGCEGVVVSHGTDTIEETAYALALQVKRRLPIALTGAMRTPGEAGADGPSNLLAAIRVARHGGAAAVGPVVVMHDEIHLARWVTKGHTSMVGSFVSPGVGPVGWIAEGRVHIAAAPTCEDFVGSPDKLEMRVELIHVVAGSDGLLIDSAAAMSQGLVVAGLGGGHVPPAVRPALESAVRRGIPVVLASRTSAGATLERTYGGPGSESDLLSLGLIPAGALAPAKARLRLMVSLALGKDPREVFPV